MSAKSESTDHSSREADQGVIQSEGYQSEESNDGVVVISEQYTRKIHYMTSSVDVPLFASLLVATGLTVLDSIKIRAVSPIITAVVLVMSVLLGSRLLDWPDIATKEGTRFHVLLNRVLCCCPFVFIMVTGTIMSVYNVHSEILLAANMQISATFLGVLGARNCREAGMLLTLHLVFVIPLPMDDRLDRLISLVFTDVFLLVAAWVKGTMIFIVDELLAQHHLAAKKYQQATKTASLATKKVEEQQGLVSASLLRAAEMKLKVEDTEKNYKDMQQLAELAVSEVVHLSNLSKAQAR